MTQAYNAATLSQAALYYDYSSAANPLYQHLISPVPYRAFAPDFFTAGPSRIQPLDLSAELGCAGPATSPTLCANFIRIAGGSLHTSAIATSQLFFVYQGAGRTAVGGQTIFWGKGDLMVLPAEGAAVHDADGEAGLYWVHDAPLLRYLGVAPTVSRFATTLFQQAKAAAKLEEVRNHPARAQANRISVLMANQAFPQTRTVTHTLWAMYGLLPAGQVQYPHRHQSVALDFVVDCQPGCYTLIGTELGADGMIRDGHREAWAPGASFVTPPGYWHSHHNESGVDAHVLPIQDAGLHTFLRTLDITFSHPDGRGGTALSPAP
jgi:gentisate 1,2-dioxygenase